MPRVLITSSLLILSLFSLSSSAHQNGDQSDVVNSGHRSSRSLVLAKAWCLLAVFAGTFLGGVSPYFLRWDERWLASGTHFAGGVFLATALIHFLADAHRTFAALTPNEYPFAFTLACAGYLLTLLAECVVSHVFHNKTRRDHSRRAVEAAQGNVEEGKVGENGGTPQSQIKSRDTHHPANPAASVATLGSFGDSVLLIVALCFHSVFEGIAIGVAETEADAWKALWTISLHKIFAAIAMGIALLRMIPNRPLLSCAAYAFAFAISSPVGVGIGILIDATTQGRAADWIFAISMGLACGVFIYVSINHLLAKGYVPQKPIHFDTPFVKFFAVLLGIGVIAIVMIWDT